MARSDIQQFLLILDVRTGVTQVRELGTDYEAALRAYEAAEGEHRGEANYDIVLVGSDSLETVKRTHASYFDLSGDGFRELVRHELEAFGAA